MKAPFLLALSFLLQLPLSARQEVPPTSPRERVYVGMVADEREGAGLLVRAVAPGSPAYKAGVREGDVLLLAGGQPMNSRAELRQLVANGQRGQSIPVEVQRGSARHALQVVLELRPDSAARNTPVESVLGTKRHVQPIPLPEHIRQEIRRHRRMLREQLASLPDGFDPAFVTDELQAIRDLARDAHASRPGWMSGRAGEISVRFRDEEGSVILYGADNKVTLELFDLNGQLLSRYALNTAAERAALPEAVLLRLRRFR